MISPLISLPQILPHKKQNTKCVFVGYFCPFKYFYESVFKCSMVNFNNFKLGFNQIRSALSHILKDKLGEVYKYFSTQLLLYNYILTFKKWFSWKWKIVFSIFFRNFYNIFRFFLLPVTHHHVLAHLDYEQQLIWIIEKHIQFMFFMNWSD